MNFRMIQSIGSIRILIKLFWVIYFLCILFGLLLSFIFFQIKGVLSYLLGFFSFSLIFFFFFLSMRKRLQGEEIEDKFSQKFAMGLGISFSFGRIFSYIVVLTLLLCLIHFGLFFLYGYMAGIFLSLLTTLAIIKIKYFK